MVRGNIEASRVAGNERTPSSEGQRIVRRGAGAGLCDVCAGPTFERHCKVICLRCGYTRDCSDP